MTVVLYTDISANESEEEGTSAEIFVESTSSEVDETETYTNEQLAVERMRAGFTEFEESIDLSDLDIGKEELGKLFSDATKNTPYLFYVNNHLSYTYRSSGNVVTVTPTYDITKEEAEKITEFCRLEIKKLSDIASQGENELERLILAHDLICMRFSYDLSLKSNNIYTFLRDGVGTCQGYAWTYMAVLREMGIECEYAASDTIVHIWLKVRIDGEWYHSDVTWDDPPSNEGKESEAERRHILFSDKKAEEDGYKDSYGASGEKCTSEKYDLADFSVISPACSCDGDVTHDGRTDLYDLVSLRLYFESQNGDISICPICSDVDRDLLFTDADAELLRDILLTNPLE